MNKLTTISEKILLEKLQESQHFIDQVANGTPDIIYVLDLEKRRITYTNQRVLDLLGHENMMLDVIHPLDYEERLSHMFKCRNLKENESIEIDIRLKVKDGSWKWFHVRDIAFKRKDDGTVASVIGVARDIHEIKLNEESLRYKDEILRGVLNSPNVGLVVYRAIRSHSGNILDFQFLVVSKSFEDFHEKRNLVGKWVFEEFPDAKIASYKRWVEVVDLGLPVTEEVCYIKNGKEHWFNISYAKFGDGFINTWQDITERKMAEKKLREQTALYESLVQAQSEMGEGISILEGLRFVYVNDALCSLYGYSREELLSMNCDELFVPEEREILSKRHDQRMQTTGMPSYGEARVRKKDGAVIDIGYTVKHMRDPIDAKKLIQISIIRDITEKKRADEKLIEQSRFIREVADAFPDVIHVYDLEKNRTVYLNRDIYEDVEFPARELEKMSLEEQGLQFLHPDDLLKLESFMQQIAAARDTDTVCNEIRLKGKDGNWHHFLSKAKVFKRDASGKVTQYLAIRTKIAVTS